MIQAINIAATGLQAATAELAHTTSNIAKVNTAGYQSRRADLVDLSPAGVALAGIGVDTSPSAQTPDAKLQRLADLANEMATLTRASILYGASGRALRAANSMIGSLFDVTAGSYDQTKDGDQDDAG